MKSIKIKRDFTLNGKLYFDGDNIEDKDFEIKEIVSLNEKGFIQPLTQKEIISLIKERENKKSFIKPLNSREGE